MNYNNVWYFAYGKRYYLTHPWQWIKEVGYNIRAAWQRATRGWTYMDVWNMDTWFLHTIPPMLRYLAENGNTYPGVEPFDGEYGPQRWKDWLIEKVFCARKRTNESRRKKCSRSSGQDFPTFLFPMELRRVRDDVSIEAQWAEVPLLELYDGGSPARRPTSNRLFLLRLYLQQLVFYYN